MPALDELDLPRGPRLPPSPYARASRDSLDKRGVTIAWSADRREARLTNRISKAVEVWRLQDGCTDLYEHVATEATP